MIDADPILTKLSRLVNDPAVDIRHRRIIQETARMMKLMNEELSRYKGIDELFETSDRLQQTLAEELEKQND